MPTGKSGDDVPRGRSDPADYTGGFCSSLGKGVVVVGVGLVLLGVVNDVVFDASRPFGGDLWAAGSIYVLGGLAFRPETWARVGYPYYPSRTPVAAGIPTVWATAGLWVGTIQPLLFG